eukprot:TRINITY_DN4998_c0_g1_i1.p1 TRINITY_DN4998_c0_g1~~TRINITY_DN4998_c0_g1_i1.p1  ORF type:complete len:297 (-),score=73.80 TRINITY_DN4998_c0_g1_i1:30-920(-)
MLNPDDFQTWYLLGVLSYALAIYTTKKSDWSKCQRIWEILLKMLMGQKDSNQALASVYGYLVECHLALLPDEAKERDKKIAVAKKLAEVSLKAVTEEASESWIPLRSLARCSLAERKLPSSVDFYKKAIKKKASPPLVLELATIFAQNGELASLQVCLNFLSHLHQTNKSNKEEIKADFLRSAYLHYYSGQVDKSMKVLEDLRRLEVPGKGNKEPEKPEKAKGKAKAATTGVVGGGGATSVTEKPADGESGLSLLLGGLLYFKQSQWKLAEKAFRDAKALDSTLDFVCEEYIKFLP